MPRPLSRTVPVALRPRIALGLVLALASPAFALAGASAPAAVAAATMPATGAAIRDGSVKRVVSLMPSVTEDLFAIGAGPGVLASSTFTTYPPAAARLPQLNSFSSIDTERIASLHPDLVVGVTSQAALVRDVKRIGLRVLLLDDDSYESLFANLHELGRLTGHARDADRLAASLRARTALLVAKAKGETSGRPRPRVFFVVGVQPLYTIGDKSYIATLLNFAGLQNVTGDLPQAYAPYSAEALVANDPDAIVGDRKDDLLSVLGQAPWNALRAVRDRHVYVIGNADVILRPGPRYNEGLEWLVDHVTSEPRS